MEYIVLLQPAIMAVASFVGVVLALKAITRVRSDDAPTRTTYDWRLGRRGLAIAAAGFLVASALVVTPPGSRGVIFTAAGGVDTHERAEGFSFVLPVFQSSVQMNVRTQKLFVEALSQSQDLQEITALVTVNWHVDPTKAAELYRDVGRGYPDVVIRPAVLQLAKQEIGLVQAAAFPRQRGQLAADIAVQLAGQVSGFGVIIEFVNIEDAVFQPAFITAVQNKVIADEEADEQRRLVEAERHKKAQIILQAEAAAADIRLRADAQAEANKAVAESLTSDLLVWQRIVRWSGQLPETFIGNEDPLDLLFTVNP